MDLKNKSCAFLDSNRQLIRVKPSQSTRSFHCTKGDFPVCSEHLRWGIIIYTELKLNKGK